MSAKTHDIAVVGLGAMGSAAAYHLAKRGKRVIAFDLSTPPHGLGSTHGESRIIREAQFENPLYVPIVQRAYELWTALQKDAGTDLLLETGGLLFGPDNGTLIAGTRLSADRHGVRYEIYEADEIREQFPMFDPNDDTVALYEPRSGILLPEPCVTAHLTLAEKHGAEIHLEEPVVEWKPDKGGVRIKTSAGEYHAAQMVLTPGAWLRQFLPDLRLPLTVERQVIHWFEPLERPDLFALNTLPVFAWEYEPEALFYGFPILSEGVKVGLHHQGILIDPDELDREVEPEEVEGMRMILEGTIPVVAGKLLRSEVCMYTNTPDENFLIDFHPDLPQVLIVSACSGHGFKYASVIGETVAELAVDRKATIDLTPFRIARMLGGK